MKHCKLVSKWAAFVTPPATRDWSSRCGVHHANLYNAHLEEALSPFRGYRDSNPCCSTVEQDDGSVLPRTRGAAGNRETFVSRGPHPRWRPKACAALSSHPKPPASAGASASIASRSARFRPRNGAGSGSGTSAGASVPGHLMGEPAMILNTPPFPNLTAEACRMRGLPTTDPERPMRARSSGMLDADSRGATSWGNLGISSPRPAVSLVEPLRALCACVTRGKQRTTTRRVPAYASATAAGCGESGRLKPPRCTTLETCDLPDRHSNPPGESRARGCVGGQSSSIRGAGRAVQLDSVWRWFEAIVRQPEGDRDAVAAAASAACGPAWASAGNVGESWACIVTARRAVTSPAASCTSSGGLTVRAGLQGKIVMYQTPKCANRRGKCGLTIHRKPRHPNMRNTQRAQTVAGTTGGAWPVPPHRSEFEHVGRARVRERKPVTLHAPPFQSTGPGAFRTRSCGPLSLMGCKT